MLRRIGKALVSFIIIGSISMLGMLMYTGVISRDVYETTAPELPAFTRPAVLVLNKTNGFIHRDAIPAADAMLKKIAEEQGWDIFFTDNAASHNAKDLSRFRLVVWNNTSGDILTAQQRSDFRAWLEQGGGWVGIHAAGGDPSYQWDWYVDTLIGAQFIGHTLAKQFRDADILVVDVATELTRHLPPVWRIAQEEWYAFDSNPRHKGYQILLAADEQSYMSVQEGRGDFMPFHMEGEHPLVWRHSLQQGRVFYSAIGHQAATYKMVEYEQLIAKAMRWAMADKTIAAAVRD
jgi:type 1 glutamine amidotransferase